MNAVLAGSFSASFIVGIGSLAVYLCLIGVTIALFIMYMKRLLTLGFLVTISPLITITYSIDKLGDNKSQALSTWMKEFVYNVLIQPFHCIIYMIFVSSAIKVLNSEKSLTVIIFAVAAILFIFKAEDIIKKIFGFDKASSAEGMLAAGAMAGSALSRLASGKSSNKNGNKSSGKGKGEIKRKPVPNANKNSNSGSNSSTNSTSKNTTSSSKNTKAKSAFSRATSDMIGNAKENFKEFKANPGKSIANGAKQLALKELAASAKIAPKLITGLVISGATGNAMTGFAAGAATNGNRFTRKVSNMAENGSDKITNEREAKKLASAYEGYRMAHSNLSDEELYNKSADLLTTNVGKLKDKNEINLAKQLQSMQRRYEQQGVENPGQKVMDQLEDIQAGNIRGRTDISLDRVEASTQQLKQVKSAGEINRLCSAVMKDMDLAKGNYLKSDEFKGLEKDEKDLAKEIFKAKEVLGAIGDNTNDKINKEIQKSVDRALLSKNNK